MTTIWDSTEYRSLSLQKEVLWPALLQKVSYSLQLVSLGEELC